MRYLTIFFCLLLLGSCLQNKTMKIDELKTGSFKTVLEDGDITSTAIRNDSLQIETYKGVKDTFMIKWLDQFEYVLVKQNPKSLLDSTPFHVKITSLEGKSYEFRAYYKGSNFKQKGTAYKLD